MTLTLALVCMAVPARTACSQAEAPTPPGKSDVDTSAAARTPFERWLGELLTEARQRGYSEDLLARTLVGIQPLAQVLERDRTQPEVTLTFEQYVSRRLTPEVVRRGQTLVREHGPLLARVQERYGVPPAVIVAIWGMESRFGRHSGDTPVFPALATLAWSPRRGPFFRRQLFDALTIVARGHIEAPSMLGSWAGAMGQPQFMPSSYLAYAVDFDGDGRRDIWASHADTFASIANYLRSHGWRADEPWGLEVRVPDGSAPRIAADLGTRTGGCRAMREIVGPVAVAHWRRLGVRRADGGELPAGPREVGLVRAGQRHFLVHQNYDALLRYNCAHHYALTVALLAERLDEGEATPPPPGDDGGL